MTVKERRIANGTQTDSSVLQLGKNERLRALVREGGPGINGLGVCDRWWASSKAGQQRPAGHYADETWSMSIEGNKHAVTVFENSMLRNPLTANFETAKRGAWYTRLMETFQNATILGGRGRLRLQIPAWQLSNWPRQSVTRLWLSSSCLTRQSMSALGGYFER
jgi:hypothetical protein